MESDALWERLLESLRAAHGEVEALEDRIRLPALRSLEIVMTPREWSELVGVAYGSVEPALALVLDHVDAAGNGTPYLVYHQYDLRASASEVLPPDPQQVRLEEWRRLNPDAELAWVAYAPPRPSGDGPRSGPPPEA